MFVKVSKNVVLGLLAVTVVASPALAGPQSGVGGERIRRERLQERSTAASPLDQEVQRLTDSVLTLLEKERVIVRAMRETPVRTDSALRARRGLERQLNAVSLQNMRMQSRLRELCSRSGQPDGWMGITFSGEYHLMSQAPLTLPNERYGTAIVFRVFDRVSYALVMNVSKSVFKLDLVQNP